MLAVFGGENVGGRWASGGRNSYLRASTPQDLWNTLKSRYDSRYNYFEMQVHGGVDWTMDVAEMQLHPNLKRDSPRAHAAAIKFAATHKIPVVHGAW